MWRPQSCFDGGGVEICPRGLGSAPGARQGVAQLGLERPSLGGVLAAELEDESVEARGFIEGERLARLVRGGGREGSSALRLAAARVVHGEERRVGVFFGLEGLSELAVASAPRLFVEVTGDDSANMVVIDVDLIAVVATAEEDQAVVAEVLEGGDRAPFEGSCSDAGSPSDGVLGDSDELEQASLRVLEVLESTLD